MSDEAAKELAEAIRQLAAAVASHQPVIIQTAPQPQPWWTGAPNWTSTAGEVRVDPTAMLSNTIAT